MTIDQCNKIKSLYLRSFDVNETMSQLKCGGIDKLMSWGFRKPISWESKALLFRVSGYIHKGYVLITLNWDDTYTIHLLNMNYDVKKTIKDIYCDELTDVIDKHVETK